VDGMPGLEGYYLEHDRDLREEERVRFAYGEETMPRFDPSAAPRLEARNWPQERLERTRRRYAMDYVRTMFPVLEDLLGPVDARAEVGRVARLVGLQFQDECARELVTESPGAAGAFAGWLKAMLEGQGEDVVLEDSGAVRVLTLARWKLADGLALQDLAGAFTAWNELWAGACLAHDRFLQLEVACTVAEGGLAAQWRLTRG
jgi:hypothetical protein